MSLPSLPAWLALSIFTFALHASHAQTANGCAAPRVLVERFISADCEGCWSDGKAPEATALVLDWIVPSARGEDVPLAAAAIADATPRAGAISASRTRERRHTLRPPGELALVVEDGPGWNGYIAAQMHVERRVEREAKGTPAGAVAYLALVERVRAGEEGTPVDRMLVRSVAGPLPLDPGKGTVTHLRAFRIPQGSKPARLTAIGWVETPSGAMLAAAGVVPEACMPAR